jgi:D-proline reductase (dithiol) PrdB
MKVDDYKYLPRMYRSLYENKPAIEEGKVWAEFDKRLSRARVALLSSAGLYLRSQQRPFDVERERREPTWGDASHRLISRGAEPSELAMSHLHVRNDEVLADPNIALPLAPLADLVESGFVGGATAEHVSVMGYQGWYDDALDRWREETAPAIARALEEQDADGVVLAPV